MGDNLAELMYAAWRAELPDPTSAPNWGNILDADGRRAWEAAAAVARVEMRRRLLGVGADSATDTYVTPLGDGSVAIDRVSHHGACVGRERATCACDPIVTSDRHFPRGPQS